MRKVCWLFYFYSMEYKSFEVTIENHIAHISINKPDKANALHTRDWATLRQAFEDFDANPEVRVVVLSGNGKHFCAGMEMSAFTDMYQNIENECEARKRLALRDFILGLQASISSPEKCSKPVLAAIHNGCIGGAVDLVTACDMRYCTNDAYFTIKEIDLGIVADIGTLQRLPKIINPSIAAEMAYTARKVYGAEAKEIGLVNQTFEDKETMLKSVLEIAKMIASKSPICVRGTKEMLLYQRDHSVEDSLKNMANYNAGMLISKDITKAFEAFFTKQAASFDN